MTRLLRIFIFLLFALTAAAQNSCEMATIASVNASDVCLETTSVIFQPVGLSATPLPACSPNAQVEIWLSFTALETSEMMAVMNNSAAYNFAVYSGDCGDLTLLQCEQQSPTMLIHDLVVGQSYFLRILSNTFSTTSFEVCITAPASCSNAHAVCGIQNFPNTVNVPSQGGVGCLFTSPNPTFFQIHIAQSGLLKLNLTQSSLQDGNPNIDVDFAAWGPFTSSDQGCAEISTEDGLAPPAHCSYSSASTETVTLPNAQAGENYLLMVTNFSNETGYINIDVMPESTAAIACNGISMQAFLDVNANGMRDAGEQDFPLGSFGFQQIGGAEVGTGASQDGHFTLYDDDATHHYKLSYELNPDYASFYSATGSYANVETASPPLTYLFPVSPIADYQDVSLAFSPLSSPIAGGTYMLNVAYKNCSPQTISSGNVVLNGPGIGPVTTDEPDASVNGNVVTLPFSQLAPFEKRQFTVLVSVPPLPEITLGQLLTCTGTVSAAISDAIPSNNTASVTQEVVASYDPNDKIESHGGKIAINTFSPDDFLTYTIRFENTGTIPAGLVVVTDKLDQKLNESAVEFLASSHPCTMEKLGRNLSFEFGGIDLPVSVPGTDIGKGFVTFRVKPESGFGPGTLIPNSAKIYFDVNPPINTNIWITEFTTALAVSDFGPDSFAIYPNPAGDKVHVWSQGEMMESVSVFDMIGKKVRSNPVHATHADLDVSDLGKGVYLVEITGTNSKSIKKLIVQ